MGTQQARLGRGPELRGLWVRGLPPWGHRGGGSHSSPTLSVLWDQCPAGLLPPQAAWEGLGEGGSQEGAWLRVLGRGQRASVLSVPCSQAVPWLFLASRPAASRMALGPAGSGGQRPAPHFLPSRRVSHTCPSCPPSWPPPWCHAAPLGVWPLGPPGLG